MTRTKVSIAVQRGPSLTSVTLCADTDEGNLLTSIRLLLNDSEVKELIDALKEPRKVAVKASVIEVRL